MSDRAAGLFYVFLEGEFDSRYTTFSAAEAAAQEAANERGCDAEVVEYAS